MMRRHPDRILCVMEGGPAIVKLADHIEAQLEMKVTRAASDVEALELIKRKNRYDVLLSARTEAFRHIVEKQLFTLFILLAISTPSDNWLLDDSRYLGVVDAANVHKVLTIIVMGFTIRRS